MEAVHQPARSRPAGRAPFLTTPLPAARIATRVLSAYALPAVAAGAAMTLVQIYFLKFATDVLLVGPAAIGLLFAASRVWDAVSDPLAGYWSDRTLSARGRRRPWLRLGAPALGVAVVALWSPPASLTGPALLFWIGLAIFGLFTAQTAYQVPHVAWGAELSLDYHERSRVYAAREIGDKLGFFAALGGLVWLERSADPRAVAPILAFACALGIVAATAACLRRVPERRDYQKRGPERLWRAASDVWRNRDARLLLSVFFLEHLGFATVGTLLPYASDYVLGTPGMTAAYLLAFVTPILLSVPGWLALSRRFGKKRVWIAGMLLKVVAFATLFAVSGDALWVVFACIAVIGAGHGCGSVIPPSIQADLIDVDELATGERKEGTYFAAWNLTGKCAIAVSLAASGLALDAMGFEPNVEQTARVQWTIRVLIAALPCALLLLATLLFRRFSLDEAAHRRVRAALDARATAQTARAAG